MGASCTSPAVEQGLPLKNTEEKELKQTVQQRRKTELNQWHQIQASCARRPLVVSLKWWNSWVNFVNGKVDNIPGPIDNCSLDNQCLQNIVRLDLKPYQDYYVVTTQQWDFLFKKCK